MFLEDQNPDGRSCWHWRYLSALSRSLTPSQHPKLDQHNMSTQKDKGFKPKFYDRRPAISVLLSLARPMQARQPSSSESVLQQNSPKFSIPRAMRFMLYTWHYVIEWSYWQIDLSELNPTAKVTKNFFVITSFSISDSEESTMLRMKWYLTVIQNMSSMTLVVWSR